MKSNKLKLSPLLRLALMAALAISCTPIESDTKQLTDVPFKCLEIPQSQVDTILRDFPNNFAQGPITADLNVVRNIVAHMPDEHIQDLAKEVNNGFNVYYSSIDGYSSKTTGLTGVTFTDGGGMTLVSCSSMQIKGRGALDDALLHELGHCMQGLQQNKFPGEFSWENADVTKNIYDDGNGRKSQLQSMNPPVRSYAFSSKHELFAEAYDNYYCGSESNQYLKRTFPMMHQLMRDRFETPRWETSNSTTTPQNTDQESIGLHFVAGPSIQNGSYTNFLDVSLPANITQIKICYGDEATCRQSQTSNVATVTSPIALPNRQTFRTSQTITIQNDSVLTVLGYDASNPSTPSIARDVRFGVQQ